MSLDLSDLYQEVILDHSRRPRNFGELEGADRQSDGYNPLCGDRVSIFVKLDGDRIEDIRFKGSGCAISTASASLLTEVLKGKSISEAEELFGFFHDLVTGKGLEEKQRGAVGKLAALGGVRDYPVRVKCATLVWHTLRAALEGKAKPVSTEFQEEF